MSATIRAFMYHDIRDLSETNFPERYKLKSFLNKRQFEHQINLINEKYEIISSEDILKIDFSDNIDYAVLTFDDGLSDHFYVYNFLKEKNIGGTFFIPKNPIENNKVMNTHKIQFILSSFDNKKICEEILSNFVNKEQIWEEYSKTKWKNNWWSKEMIFVTNFLRRHKINFNNYEYTNFLFDKYVTKKENEFAKKLYLNSNEIEEMANNKMIIGGHGDISENLILMDDFESDIKNSYDYIKKYNNNFVFSYPNGGYNDEIKKIMKKNNCLLSFTVNQMTITELDDVDYLEFPRYDAPQKLSLK
jgi:hypothetical protein